MLQTPVNIYKDGIPIMFTESEYDNQKEIGDTTVLLDSLKPSFFNDIITFVGGSSQSLNNKKDWKYKHGSLIKNFTEIFSENSLNFVQYITKPSS